MSARGLLCALLLPVLLAGCERPPMETAQIGYRGTGMVAIDNPRITGVSTALHAVPPAIPAVPAGGPAAAEVYQNVQVLGQLDVASFNRLMAAITSWVAPQQGCAYCHELNNFASDALYTKVVSRRMIEMTQYINAEWDSHVAATGVTCYTCHRGRPVPANLWFENPGPPQARGMAANRQGQNVATQTVGYTSLPYDPFTPYFRDRSEIRVVSTTALPTGNPQGIKAAEQTYGLMMHMSQALGVNCTYCHNSRSFLTWEQSRPQRATAWHGIRMVVGLNTDYLDPLQPVYPPERLGAQGDAPKLNCTTCHQGLYKPLYGNSMLADYPVLASLVPVSLPVEAVPDTPDAPAAVVTPVPEPAVFTLPATLDLVQGEAVYQQVCSVCHVRGIVAAPRYGNQEEWAPRLEQGYDALVAKVLNGYKGMPAKGGRVDLPDEAIINALGYLLNSVL